MTCGKVIAAATALTLVSGAALAAPMSRDQVRIRVLDQCVLGQSGKAEGQGAGPKCNCYAPKVVKLMTDEEVAKFRKKIPSRLKTDAEKILATCK
jgi:hypothetical protein